MKVDFHLIYNLLSALIPNAGRHTGQQSRWACTSSASTREGPRPNGSAKAYQEHCQLGLFIVLDWLYRRENQGKPTAEDQLPPSTEISSSKGSRSSCHPLGNLLQAHSHYQTKCQRTLAALRLHDEHPSSLQRNHPKMGGILKAFRNRKLLQKL